MSTTARKARKRAGTPFVRTAKVGTPVEERAENQPRPIAGTAWLKQRRVGLPSRVIARLRARGIDQKGNR